MHRIAVQKRPILAITVPLGIKCLCRSEAISRGPSIQGKMPEIWFKPGIAHHTDSAPDCGNARSGADLRFGCIGYASDPNPLAVPNLGVLSAAWSMFRGHAHSGERDLMRPDMLTQQAAKKLANKHLSESGARFVAARATRSSEYGVWTVSYVDPDQPDEMLTGGALVVTDEGDVHELGSAPGALAELMATIQRLPLRVGDVSVGSEPSLGAAQLPASWHEHLGPEFKQDYWRDLVEFVAKERAEHDVFPAAHETFAAFELTPLDQVRVVILGQDPYHGAGQAHGLSFSVPPGVRVPPSLKNIHKQLAYDLGIPAPEHGCLDGWATQGVLLLNATLTVRKSAANAHRRSGWSHFTDAAIKAVNASAEPVVFMLWGKAAQVKADLITAPHHRILASSHPSGFSARLGFNTSRPFSQANDFLHGSGRGSVDWSMFRVPSVDEGARPV